MQPSCSLIYNKSILFHRRFVLKYSTKSASDKLFEDAAREEAEAASGSTSSSTRVVEQHENWDGDERIQDTVLRMLVDKYKPLRTGSIQFAEQKLKHSPPQLLGDIPLTVITTFPTTPNNSLKPSGGSWATQPLLPSSEDHRPWHTTFKVPSHEVSSVKLANLPPSISSTRTRPQFSVDEHERKKEREAFKRTQQAGRLTQARESTLDYKLGVKDAHANAPRTNPVGLKGWTSLVEDKIEKARKAGLFNIVKGRGRPLTRAVEEFNPFVPREEFLMNRIVQRNGAAPPWIEVQGELENAVQTFRANLRQSWVRRILRNLTTSHPQQLLSKLTTSDVEALRDPDWVRRGQSYHDIAIAELNNLVRKHNVLAPYTVRRPYYEMAVEIEKMYKISAGDILNGIEKHGRVLEMERLGQGQKGLGGDDDGGGGGSSSLQIQGLEGNFDHVARRWWLGKLIRRWLDMIW